MKIRKNKLKVLPHKNIPWLTCYAYVSGMFCTHTIAQNQVSIQGLCKYTANEDKRAAQARPRYMCALQRTRSSHSSYVAARTRALCLVLAGSLLPPSLSEKHSMVFTQRMEGGPCSFSASFFPSFSVSRVRTQAHAGGTRNTTRTTVS